MMWSWQAMLKHNIGASGQQDEVLLMQEELKLHAMKLKLEANRRILVKGGAYPTHTWLL